MFMPGALRPPDSPLIQEVGSGGTPMKRLQCRYRTALEYAKSMAIAHMNQMHAEIKKSHAPTYAMVRPTKEQLNWDMITERSRLDTDSMQEAGVLEAFSTSQAMLDAVLGIMEENRARDIARIAYPRGDPRRRRPTPAPGPSKDLELAMAFSELPMPLDEVQPLVDSVASVTPGTPTYQQTMATMLPHYAMIISSTVFDGHLTPAELLGQPDASTGRATAPGIEALYKRQDSARDAIDELRGHMAHLFSFIYEHAFAAYDMRRFYDVLHEFDEAYRERMAEVLLEGGGRRRNLGAHERATLAAEAAGAKDDRIRDLRDALLLKMVGGELFRATLVFEDEDEDGRPTRDPMDPLSHEQAHKDAALLLQMVEGGSAHSDDARKIIGERLGFELKKQPPRLKEAEVPCGRPCPGGRFSLLNRILGHWATRGQRGRGWGRLARSPARAHGLYDQEDTPATTAHGEQQEAQGHGRRRRQRQEEAKDKQVGRPVHIHMHRLSLEIQPLHLEIQSLSVSSEAAG